MLAFKSILIVVAIFNLHKPALMFKTISDSVAEKEHELDTLVNISEDFHDEPEGNMNN